MNSVNNHVFEHLNEGFIRINLNLETLEFRHRLVKFVRRWFLKAFILYLIQRLIEVLHSSAAM